MKRYILAALLFLSVSAEAQPNLPPSLEIANLAYFQTHTLGHNVHLQGNTVPGDAGQGYFTQNGKTCAPDNVTIIKDGGGNCYYRTSVISSSAIPASLYNIKADNSTDNCTTLQQLATAAAAGTNAVIFDVGTGIIRFSCPINWGPGTLVQGQGRNNTWFRYTGLSGWGFQQVQPNGANSIEGVKYSNFSMLAIDANTSAGGCIRYNTPTGGFTNDATTQQPIVHAAIQNVYCSGNNIVGITQILFQCSKCFESDFSNNETIFGFTGIDLEGCDGTTIGAAGPNRFGLSQGPLVRVQSQLTFGNMDTIYNGELLFPMDVSQTLDSYIYFAPRTGNIQNVHIEGSKTPTSVIHIPTAFGVGINNNDVEVTGAPWLQVDTAMTNLSAFNQGIVGNILSPAKFGVAGVGVPYYFNAATRFNVCHGGNSDQGDINFPANCKDTSLDTPTFANKVLAYFDTGIDGMEYVNDGQTVLMQNGDFIISTVGTVNNHYLQFGNTFGRSTVNASMDMWVYAASNSSGGILGCSAFDNATPGTTVLTAALPTQFNWYLMNAAPFNAASLARIRCWRDTTGSDSIRLKKVVFVAH